MNEMWFLAYVVMPLAVVALGYAAVRWNERHDKRHDNGKRG